MALAPIQFSGASLVPDIAGGIQRGQQILQGENVLAQQRLGLQQQEQAAQQREKGKELIRRQKAGEQIQTGAELAELFVDNPELAQNVLRSAGIANEFQKNDFGEFGFKLEQAGGNPELQQQLIQQRIQEVTARGGDPKDTAALLIAPPERIAQFARTAQLAALSPQERMKIAQDGKQGMASAKTLLNPDGSSIQALPNQQVVVRNPLGEIVEGQERLAVLKQAAEAQIEQKRREAGVSVEAEKGKAEAKAGVELKFKPAIQAAVKLAEEAAKSRGETLTALGRSEAALPGLIRTVDALKELAPIATSTVGGKLIDTAAKELGFGTTKGATARAKFIATINNQVLPLLKETFGAAFTFAEGESLKATMGDPDASPAEKIAQLESFIDQKKRDIETRERELGTGADTAGGSAQPSPQQVLRFDAQGNLIQ